LILIRKYIGLAKRVAIVAGVAAVTIPIVGVHFTRQILLNIKRNKKDSEADNDKN
tara:strand:+ start:952 stop:1116 length:165 start_codon:yes stop_codon:yes gene_type:complete